jgi:adenylate cyclase
LRKLFNKHGARWGIGLALVFLACLHALNFIPSNTLERLDTYFYDLRVRVQQPKLDPRVVIVDIDEKSLNEIGRWPWSRNVIADLVTNLTDEYQVRAVGFDIQFSEPDLSSGYTTLEAMAKNEMKDIPSFETKLQELKPQLDYDERLAKAIKGKPVILGYFLSESQKKGLLPPPAFTVADLNGRRLDAIPSKGYEGNIAQLQEAARSGGFFNADLDPDGILRSTLLMGKIGDGYYESLGLATARVAMGATKLEPVFLKSTSRDYGAIDSILLNTQPVERRVPVEELLKVQVDFRGKGGPEGGGFRYVSATDVLHKRLTLQDLARCIVLVGTTAPGLNDLRATPMNSEYPGVEAHANIIASILDGKFKQRPDFAVGYDLVQVLFVGAVLIFALSLLRPLPSMLFTVGSGVAVIWFNFWAYRSANLILPVATLLLLMVSLFIFNVAWGYWFEFRKGRAITNLFGEYVAPELVEVMADDPENYNMEGDKRELTIMFADVRNFTTISESLEANTLREYINKYLTDVSEDIRGNRGTLDKYIGDCVMAFWGAPVPLTDHASRAVATALLMQKTAKRLNQEYVERGWPPLKIGIGVNTGEARVGDMGSKIRRAYTVMGDPVNLAARLEGLTKEYGVGLAVGDATKRAAPLFAYRELDRVRVKGKNEPVAIYEPICLESELDAEMRRTLTHWHEALALYREQKWDKSEAIVRKLYDQYPDDWLYDIFLERIEEFRAEPPGPDWDGVTNFKTK